MDTTFAQHWNLSIGLSLICLWVMWAFLVRDDVLAWRKGKGKADVTNCPFCRGMHGPGECRRDKADD